MGKNYTCGKELQVGRNSKWEEIPESGEMHEWEEITEPAKVQEWERFPSAGKLQSAGNYSFARNLQKCAKRRKVPGQSVVRLTLVLQSRADAMMQGTDGSTLEKSEVRALMRSIV